MTTAPHDHPLPYDFDLLYDLKTLGQAHDHLTGRQRFAVSAPDREVAALLAEAGLPLPAGYALPGKSAPEPGFQHAQAVDFIQRLYLRAAAGETLACAELLAETKRFLESQGQLLTPASAPPEN